MRVIGLASREVTWAIAPRGAARDRTSRTAILVELWSTSHGGLGEAAPLADRSRDTLAAAAAAIAEVAARVPFAIGSTGDVFAFAADIASPAARFAIETALLDLLAHERGVTVADLLAVSPVRELACAVVVDDVAEARAALDAGAICLKLKISPGRVDHVRVIAAAAPGIPLRLDANRSFARAAVPALLDALADLPIQFVEEPCASAITLGKLALPIALDESLADLAPGFALPSTIAAVVLKPTLLGGFANSIELAARARAAGIPIVVTHALEGPIGTAACIELARALGGPLAAGLAPHSALVRDSDIPQLRATRIVAAPAPGLGLAGDLDAIVAGLRASATTAPADIATLAGPVLEPVHRGALSIAAAATEAGDRLAIVTDGETLTFGECATAASALVRARIATPEIATLVAIYAMLEAGAPIGLVHAKATADEQARQCDVLERAELPPGTACVLFTSGSTGVARGVALSRDAIAAAAAASAAHLGWRDDDRWLLALSLAHAGGLAVAVRCLAARKPVVLVEDARRIAAMLVAHRVTLASLVPTQLDALLEDPAWHPPPQLRAVLLGGAAASPALLARAAARGVPFLVTYGMTETFGQVATAPIERAGDRAAPLVPLPGVTLVAGSRAAPARIRIRAWLPEVITSDLGFIEAGALHIVGRADDVIITGGENVHPATVEAVLAATPGVRMACVFGVPDAQWGNVIGAAIAVDAGFDRERAVATWHAALPPHARPRRLAVAGALPVLPTGKIDRRAAAALPDTPVLYRSG